MGRMVIIKKSFTNPKSIYAILLLGIFTFLFLGAEYLYVNMISLTAGEEKNGDCAKLRVRNKRCRFFALSAVSSLFEKAGTNRWTFYPCTSSGSMQFFGSKTCFLFVHSALPEWHCSSFLGILGSAAHYLFFQTGEGSHASGAYGWYLLCPWDLPAVSK